jgi:hypothetical protein
MGLKGYRLWVMGQLDSNVQGPATLSVCAFTRTLAVPTESGRQGCTHSQVSDWLHGPHRVLYVGGLTAKGCAIKRYAL